ncbi:promotilin-like isoform X2 [Erpetoichthys calabaricus]|uniref:promotilin-like isoform X2 n=1 Tax=Erpetoichthys calabaricus TaxID=27687 RepID=UPI00223403E4|nr:promotilin-like isoform X2 [Erpetoichthys calabaricus]
MAPGRVMVSLLLVSMLLVLVDQTEGFLSFFSPTDMKKMLEKEKLGKKSVSLQQRSEESVPGELPSAGWYIEKTEMSCPMEIGMRLTPQQIKKYGPILAEMLNQLLLEKGTAK